MRIFSVNVSLFLDNRKRFFEKMKDNSVAIFVSNEEVPSNADAFHTFKQNSDLLWLCGVSQPETSLVLVKKSKKDYSEFLFIKKSNPDKEIWDGNFLTKGEAQKITGIENIRYCEEFDHILQLHINSTNTIYLNSNEHDRKRIGYLNTEDLFIKKIKQRFPLHNYERSALILKNLRCIKNKYEIELIKKAIDITDHGFRELLRKITPNIYEYEIEAELIYYFLKQGASGFAFNPIIASGDNARILHYVDNNNLCRNGDLVLIDFGVSYGNYNSDITRTIPVNGIFTKRQKEIYNVCMKLNQFAESILKPGMLLKDYNKRVGDEATKLFLEIGLLNQANIKNESLENRAYTKFLYHGISHHLGVDVHDLFDSTSKIKEGMVLTIEPGVYVKEEKIGIRLENNVLITKKGALNLSKSIPIKPEEIELLMKR